MHFLFSIRYIKLSAFGEELWTYPPPPFLSTNPGESIPMAFWLGIRATFTGGVSFLTNTVPASFPGAYLYFIKYRSQSILLILFILWIISNWINMFIFLLYIYILIRKKKCAVKQNYKFKLFWKKRNSIFVVWYVNCVIWGHRHRYFKIVGTNALKYTLLHKYLSICLFIYIVSIYACECAIKIHIYLFILYYIFFQYFLY